MGMTVAPVDLKRLVRIFYERIWGAHDLDLVTSLTREHFSFRGSLGTQSRGRAEFIDYVNSIHAALADYNCEIVELVAEDNKVFARMTFSGIHRGNFMGQPPTYKHIQWSGAAIFTFDQDRIADLWVLGDLHGLLLQLNGEK